MQSETQLAGYIYQYERVTGCFKEAKRFAKVFDKYLLIYADKNRHGLCLKVSLHKAQIDFYRENSNWDPWILITEDTGIIYYIKPERAEDYYHWCDCLRKAAGVEISSNDIHKQLKRSCDTWTNKITPANIEKHVTETTNKSAKTRQISNHYPYHQVEEDSRRFTRILSESSSENDVLPERERNGNVSQAIRANSHNNPHALNTIKEYSHLRDSEVKKTNGFADMRTKFPIHGLAKRMSISASEMLGKSRDEIIILLIQLNREKANLMRWKEFFTVEIDKMMTHSRTSHPVTDDVEELQLELEEVNNQLKMTAPLVSFLDNMVKMGDLYGGDDAMFATEYRKHLLARHEYTPVKSNIEFMRRVQEKDVAKSLDRIISDPEKNFASTRDFPTSQLSQIAGIYTSVDLLRKEEKMPTRLSGSRTSIDLMENFPEQPAFCQRRLQLEKELNALEQIWTKVENIDPSIYTSDCTKATSITRPSRRIVTPVCKRVLKRNLPERHNGMQADALVRSSMMVSSGMLHSPELNKRPSSAGAISIPRRSTKYCPRSDLMLTLSRHRSLQSLNSDSNRIVPKVEEPDQSLLSYDPSSELNSLVPESSKITRRESRGIIDNIFLEKPEKPTNSRWKVQSSVAYDRLSQISPFPDDLQLESDSEIELDNSVIDINYQGLRSWKSYCDNLTNIGQDITAINELEAGISKKSQSSLHNTGISHLQKKLDALMLNADDYSIDNVSNISPMQRCASRFKTAEVVP